MTQYRTLGEGDRRLPGYECRLRYVPHAQWVPSDAVGIIDADDIRRSEYRVPCSATVAPDGYEVVQRERLPKGAIVRRETWAVWSARKDAWLPAEGGYPCLNLADGIVYTAPADELAALYAAGDAEREQPAPVGDGWRLLGDDELIAHGDETSEGGAPWKEIAAFEYHRAAGVFGAHNRYRRRVEPQPVEQPAPAPASPCPCCAERDRLAAENAALVRERDDARAEVAEVRRAWDATVEARDQAIAELERLRGEVARLRRDAGHVGELRRRILAATAALEGRDG